MTFAISIGCYRLADFIELNITRCRRIFGDDCCIMLSDDHCNNHPHDSECIKKLADKHQVIYWSSKYQRSHFSGDIQAIVNAVKLADSADTDIALKLSQRLIPVLPAFRECIERAFGNPHVQMALPGRMDPMQIARPGARFYTNFGILTDVVALRRGAITPELLIQVYRERLQVGEPRSACLVETTFGWLMEHKFKGRTAILASLTNHIPMQPKIYLRKAQSSADDYKQVAAMEGLSGYYDLREWPQIERTEYFGRPTAA